jgi:uncharacterized protein (DUF2235 family)
MRRLIVCSDGTWNTPDRKDGDAFAPSNVVKMARAIRPQAEDGTPQVVYYDPGLGTDNVLDKVTGGAFGIGLSRNVQRAYLFLVNNYAEGDEVYFFGFSRGAYTVRSTAGLIRNCGLLHKVHADKTVEAWRIYRSEKGPDDSDAGKFRDEHSRYPLRVKFLGVWDTVGSLGIPGLLNFIGRSRFAFHDVALSRSVDHAYQGLAIDEKRRFFAPTLWEQHPEAHDQVLEQVWFPGVHMDVGGGYRDAFLANRALLWMAEKAEATGLDLDWSYLKEVAPVHQPGGLHESRQFPYTLIPPHHRPIGEGVPPETAVYAGSSSNEGVHTSAEERYRQDQGYLPPNLLGYWNRIGHGPPAS